MKVRPLGDKIIVKRAEAAPRRDDQEEENKETGDYLPFTVKKGDAVLFSSYAGTEIKIDGEDLIIMTEEDILAVIG